MNFELVWSLAFLILGFQASSNLDKLQQELGVQFQEVGLLELALTHKSYAAEKGLGALSHNERLEFLGDAVLELVVSEHLFKQFPESPEGQLTYGRSVLVNTKSLAEAARGLGLGDYLKLSRGERQSQGAQKDSILAGAFEAVIGALYLDAGLEKARQFVSKQLLSKTPVILEPEPSHNPKGYFQEKAQELLGETPTYQVLEETGPDHAKEFRVGLYLGGQKVAEGQGPSKQAAEAEAARKALKAKGWL